MLNEKKKFNYGLVVIAICFLVTGMSLGFCSSGRELYIKPMTEALGFTRGAFSLNDTFRFISTTIINIFFGALINKFGAKKLILAGFLCLMGFSTINMLAEDLYMFYIASVLLGVGLAWTSTTMVGAVVNVWCKEENRGKLTGLILSSNGLFGAIATQILSPIIYGQTFGFRNSYRLITILLAVIFVLVLIFFKDRPKGVEKTLIQKKGKKSRGRGWVGLEYKEILKKPYFYITCVCLAFTGMALQGLSGIATPHMQDVGLSNELVTSIKSLGLIILMGTKILTGFMFDKKGIRFTMNICVISSFVAVLALVFVNTSSVGTVLAFVRVVFQDIALPLETVMIPLYASELFGNKSFMSVLGVFSAANYAGYAFGSPLGNFIFDISGSYNIAFIVFGSLMVFVFIAMQYVVKKSRKDKAIVEAQLELEESQKEEANAQN